MAVYGGGNQVYAVPAGAMRLGTPGEGDWVDLLIQYKREASANASGASSPVFELPPSHHEQTAPSEIPTDQAVCQPSADADHGWQATDVEAA